MARARHTTYADSNVDRANRMLKAYPGSINSTPGDPPQRLDEDAARTRAFNMAKEKLKPEGMQVGNYMFEPNGVDMTYTAGAVDLKKGHTITAPVLSEEPKILKGSEMKNYAEVAGAPLSRFVPNVASPGAGASGASADELGTINLEPVVPDPDLVAAISTPNVDSGSDNQKAPGDTKNIFTIGQ
jgi:hypothetical protein